MSAASRSVRGRVRLLALPLAALLLAGGLPAIVPGLSGRAALAEEDKPAKSVDASDVYLGDAKKWEKAAVVDADKVYAKIDEYKEIVDNGLKPGDAKYELLLAKASKRFHCAIKKAAKDGGYDLVARSGSVKNAGAVPDITADAIAKL